MALMRTLWGSRLFWFFAVLGLVWFGGRTARGALARDARFLAVPSRLEARGPAWGGPEAVRPVLESLDALGPISLFAPDFEERVTTALAEVPSVKRVHAVKRLWPRRYAVEVDLHRPVAVVLHEGAGIPVTRDGIALPAAPYAFASRRLFTITGIDAPPPRAGRAWRSAALADGLATALQLLPHLERIAPLGLDSIDVSSAADPRRGVVVSGIDGIVVRWGRPRAKVGENAVARKLEYLGIAARHLDRVRGFEVDVRYGTLYLRESATP